MREALVGLCGRRAGRATAYGVPTTCAVQSPPAPPGSSSGGRSSRSQLRPPTWHAAERVMHAPARRPSPVPPLCGRRRRSPRRRAGGSRCQPRRPRRSSAAGLATGPRSACPRPARPTRLRHAVQRLGVSGPSVARARPARPARASLSGTEREPFARPARAAVVAPTERAPRRLSEGSSQPPAPRRRRRSGKRRRASAARRTSGRASATGRPSAPEGAHAARKQIGLPPRRR